LQYSPPVIAVTLVCCLLAIRWAIDQFNSESVLFREGERFGLGLWLRHLMQDRQPTPTVAGAVFCGVGILLVRFFMGFALSGVAGPDNFVMLTLVTGLVVVATPALLMTVILTSSPRRTLLLRWPRGLTLPAAALLAVAIQPAARALQMAVMRLYPLSERLKPELQGLEAFVRNAPLWQLLLIMAVVPAICEELAFRGFILSGFRHLGHKWRAIVFTAVFFGLTHAIMQQSIVSCILGIVIGLLAVQSGSILPAMLFHFVHNGLLVLSTQITPHVFARWPALSYLAAWGDEGELVFHWPVVAVSAIISLALLVWLNGLTHPKSPEEELQEAIERKSQHLAHA
jgi:sodium transport system permease protein